MQRVPPIGEISRRVQRFSVQQASGRREIDLDFLRGLAILMVIDFHAPVHWMSFPLQLLGFPEIGWAGVDVFFILSGFLVGGLLIKEWRQRGALDGRRFLVRRGFKIWPQYYLFLAAMLLTGHRPLHALWGNLLNVQNYTGNVIPHTWSLAVEEHAYLLLAAGILVAARWRLRPRVLAVILALLVMTVSLARLGLAQAGYSVFSGTHTRIDGILEGVLLALVYQYRPEMFRRMQRYRWLWVGLLLVALGILHHPPHAPWQSSIGWDAANLLGISLLMLLYRPAQQARRSRGYRLLAAIGVYSYGIYLWHVAVIAPTVAAARYMPTWATGVWLAVMPVVGGVAVGVVFTRLVEVPALAIRERFYPRRTGPVLEPALSPTDRRPGRLAVPDRPQAVGVVGQLL